MYKPFLGAQCSAEQQPWGYFVDWQDETNDTTCACKCMLNEVWDNDW